MQTKKLKLLADIFFTFFKLGCVSFGGGFAMLSLIQREVAENKKWVHKDKIAGIFAVAGSLPGAIALNTSVFVGYSVAGIPGSIAAIAGNLAPSTAVVLSLMAFYSKVSSSPLAASAFKGIYPAVVGLILYAAYKIGKTAFKDVICLVIMLLAFICVAVANLPFVPVIMAGGVAGFAISRIRSLHLSKKG